MISIVDEELWNVVLTSMYEVEFDWVGIDRLGQVGLFSSFNRGYIPAKVLSSHKLYKQFMDLVNTLPHNSEFRTVFSGSGHLGYWEEITKMGIWTYDYQDAHRTEKLDHYDLIAKPAPAININQIFPIKDFNAIIPVFNLEFNGDITFEELRGSEY